MNKLQFPKIDVDVLLTLSFPFDAADYRLYLI